MLVDKGSVHTLETIKEAVQWANARAMERCCQLKPISNILEETDSFAISNASRSRTYKCIIITEDFLLSSVNVGLISLLYSNR